MALTREQSISLYGTPSYVAWGEAEAAADARAKGISGGGSSSGSGFDYNAQLGEINKSIDDYINELITQSNGDYDFAAKWIESNYAKALGTDDKQRADFLKKVASALEQKIGTVAYDYETNTYRTISDRDLALKRLDEDEMSLKRTTQEAREAQQTGLNARGLVSSAREQAQGLYGKEVGSFESGVNDRMLALQRAREDVSTGSQRSLEDITTSARRAALEGQTTRDYQIEQAKRAKEKATKLAEASRSSMKAAGEASLYSNFYG